MLQWFRVPQKFSRKLQGVSKLLQKETGSCFYSPSGDSSVNRKEWKGLQKKQKQRYRIFKTVNGFIKNRTTNMEQQQNSAQEKERVDLREPRRFKVVIHNDDFTTMDFVVLVLKTVFYKSEAESEQLMLFVHQKGAAVVGIYSYDMARTKVQKATDMARREGFPLRLSVLPEDEEL